MNRLWENKQSLLRYYIDHVLDYSWSWAYSVHPLPYLRSMPQIYSKYTRVLSAKSLRFQALFAMLRIKAKTLRTLASVLSLNYTPAPLNPIWNLKFRTYSERCLSQQTTFVRTPFPICHAEAEEAIPFKEPKARSTKPCLGTTRNTLLIYYSNLDAWQDLPLKEGIHTCIRWAPL